MSEDTAKWIDAPYSTPEMPAKNAEMQNTITRVTFVLRPMVATASGESDSPRSSRPRRSSWIRDHDQRGDAP